MWKEINLFNQYYEGKYHKLLGIFTTKATHNLWNELNIAKEDAETMILSINQWKIYDINEMFPLLVSSSATIDLNATYIFQNILN